MIGGPVGKNWTGERYKNRLTSIHDALQLRWAVIGVEDARIPTACGNEHVLVEAAKQGWIAKIPMRTLLPTTHFSNKN